MVCYVTMACYVSNYYIDITCMIYYIDITCMIYYIDITCMIYYIDITCMIYYIIVDSNVQLLHWLFLIAQMKD